MAIPGTPSIDNTSPVPESNRVALLARLLDSVRQLAETRTLDPLLVKAMEAALALFGAEAGYLILLTPQNTLDFRVKRTVGKRDILQPQEQISQTILTRVILGQESLVIADAFQETAYQDMDSVFELQIRSVMTTPLIAHGKTLGALYVENRSMAGVFKETDLPVFKLFASQVAVSIQNAMLNEQLEALVAKRTAALSQSNFELEQRIRQLQMFARSLAHDIKTPLGVIIGYADLLNEYGDNLAQNEKSQYTHAIISSADKVNQIIQGLLLFASVVDMEKVPVGPMKMDEVVNGAVVQLQHMIKNNNAGLDMRPDWPVVLGFSTWVEQVWVNLISNAIKYGGNPPMIGLGWERLPSGQIQFWVKDNGPGISPEEQERLFSPFVRLETEKRPGHGLGLNIIRNIIDRLNGSVGVKSTPGEGSLFYFTLDEAPA